MQGPETEQQCGIILRFICFRGYSSGKTILNAIHLHMHISHLLKVAFSLKTKCVF